MRSKCFSMILTEIHKKTNEKERYTPTNKFKQSEKKLKIFEIEVSKCVQTRVKYADTGMVQINRFLI